MCLNLLPTCLLVFVNSRGGGVALAFGPNAWARGFKYYMKTIAIINYYDNYWSVVASQHFEKEIISNCLKIMGKSRTIECRVVQKSLSFNLLPKSETLSIARLYYY